jgi:tRNA 2-selenouridine synthase
MAALLEDYYDKVYYKTRNWQENISISLEDFQAAARELDAFLDELPATP